MKRYIATIVAIIAAALLVLTACDPNNTPPGGNPAPSGSHIAGFTHNPGQVPAPKADAMPRNVDPLFTVDNCHLFLIPFTSGLELDGLNVKGEVAVVCDHSPIQQTTTLRIQALVNATWITDAHTEDHRKVVAGVQKHTILEDACYPGAYRLWVQVSGIGYKGVPFYAQRFTAPIHFSCTE